MFNTIRYQIANYYAKKALEEFKKGDYKAIMKGLNYFRKHISIVPTSPEREAIGMRIETTFKAMMHESEKAEP